MDSSTSSPGAETSTRLSIPLNGFFKTYQHPREVIESFNSIEWIQDFRPFIFYVDSNNKIFQFHWMDSKIPSVIELSRISNVTFNSIEWIRQRQGGDTSAVQRQLSIPLNGFAFLGVSRLGLFWLLLFQFHWMDSGEGAREATGVAKVEPSFNSIEWIRNSTWRGIYTAGENFQFHWMDSKLFGALEHECF